MDRTLEYSIWIIQFVVDNRASRELSVLMAHNFPELSVIKGHYVCPISGEFEHWWLEDVDGTVVDPTADKFPSHGIGVYRPYNEYKKSTGKCVECDSPTYDGKTCCSRFCSIEHTVFSTN